MSASRSAHQLPIRPTILIVTGQGGTGVACVDLAQNVYKCQVIVATDSEEKADFARQMGILATAQFTDEKLPRTIKKLNKALVDGVDMCIDTVGGHWFDLFLKW